jgi:hypothetical protein
MCLHGHIMTSRLMTHVIIQHTIPMKKDVKPFQQKLHKMHPSLEPQVQKELKKLLDAKIIFQV